MHRQRQFPSALTLRCQLAAAAVLIGSTTASPACTTMALGPPDRPLVAYSYDQSGTGAGVLLVNPAGVVRQSILEGPRAGWRARFGSLSFNQFGLGMPAAGMNSEGLVVTLMWNDSVAYPEPDGRPRLNELELIQFLLDTAATVDDALEAMEDVHVDAIVPVQYFLADAQGDAATLAYLDGEPVTNRGEGLPVRALTNTSYGELIETVVRFAPFGGSRPLPGPGEAGSLARFAHAAVAVRDSRSAVEEPQAFDALATVRNAETRWQVVFDPAARGVSFRSAAAPGIRSLAIGDVDPRCVPEPRFVDINAAAAGPVAGRLQPFSAAENRALAAEAFASLPALAAFGPGFPAAAAAAQYGSFRCLEP